MTKTTRYHPFRRAWILLFEKSILAIFCLLIVSVLFGGISPSFAINAVTGLKTNWVEETVYENLLVYPASLTLDGDGNLLIHERAKKEVLKLSPTGQLSTYADLSSISFYIQSTAYQPGLGRLLIVAGTTLYAFSNGQLTTVQPYGVNAGALAVKSTDDSFYAGTMTQGDSIVHYDSDGNLISTIVTNTQGCFQLALDETGNKLYYSETFSGQVVEVDLSDNSKSVIATGVGIPGTFEPIAVALDGDNNLYYFTAPQGLNQYAGGSFTKVMDSIAGVGQIIWSPVHSAFLVANGAGANIISYNPETADAEHLTQYVNALSIVEMDDGTVLVADGDSFGNFIQKVDSSGLSPFSEEMQKHCNALERDSIGNIYAGLIDGTIWKIGADGSVSSWAGGFTTDPIVNLRYDSKNNAMVSFTTNPMASTASIWRIPLSAPDSATKVVELSNVQVTPVLPTGTVDDSGNIYVLERKANVIYKIADGSDTPTVFASAVLDSEAITVPCMEYVSKENSLIISTIQNYELWPLNNPVKSTFATNNGAVDNFAINETQSGSLVAIHSGQVFRFIYGSPSLAVTPSSLTVKVGSSETATISGGTSPYTVSVSDDAKAAAVVSGNTVTVTGAAQGSVTVTVSDSASNTATLDVTVDPSTGATPSLISPQDKGSLSFSSVNGQISFSFTAVTNAAAYLLDLTLYDLINNYSIPVQIPLIPASQGGPFGGGTTGTPGFSISALGIGSYTIPLDAITWDSLGLYDMGWSVSALNDANDTSSVIGTSSEFGFKLQPSQSVTLTSPANGASLDQSTDSAPQFTWELYQGAGSYLLILAHVGSLGFDSFLEFPGQALNLFPMDDPTWQQMPTGTWYWTVIAQGAMGNPLTPNFAIFSFAVK